MRSCRLPQNRNKAVLNRSKFKTGTPAIFVWPHHGSAARGTGRLSYQVISRRLPPKKTAQRAARAGNKPQTDGTDIVSAPDGFFVLFLPERVSGKENARSIHAYGSGWNLIFTEDAVRHFSHTVFLRRFRGNYPDICGSHRIGCNLQKREFSRKMDIVYTILSDSFESFMGISCALAPKTASKNRFFASDYGNLFLFGIKKNGVSARFSRKHAIFEKWRQRDSNPRPHGCEPCALTSWAMPPFSLPVYYIISLLICQVPIWHFYDVRKMTHHRASEWGLHGHAVRDVPVRARAAVSSQQILPFSDTTI